MAASAQDATQQPQDETGAIPLRDLQQAALDGNDHDDDDEWEYEYSTTETETYYLTVELSYPEFKDRALKANYHSRGGYYRNWLGPEPEENGVSTFTMDQGNPGQNDEDNDEEPMPEPEADDGGDIDPRLRGPEDLTSLQTNQQAQAMDGDARGDAEKNKAPQQTDRAEDGFEEPTEDIQILELHSDNPLISYRGRIFEGQWAEVIGTEVLLANRDAGDDNAGSLPALRNLPGDVDLLAASAARILTTEKRLKPKVPAEDALAPIRREWNIRIPPGKDRTGERAQQARFLENLMALKKKKGETDHVTVYARDGRGKNFKDNKDPDAKPRRRKTTTGVMPGAEELQEQQQGHRHVAGRVIAQGSGRAKRRRDASLYDEDLSAAEQEALSTPTPRRWADLYADRDEVGMYDAPSDGDPGGEGEGEEEDDDRLDMKGNMRGKAHEEPGSDEDVTMAG